VTDPSAEVQVPLSLPVISISQLANQSDWTGTLSSEDPTDKEYRLNREADEARHRRWRGTVLFGFTLVGLSCVFLLCFQNLSNSQASSDDKKWATALMTAMVSGSVGFVAGKAIA
jgi:hypothetical protein